MRLPAGAGHDAQMLARLCPAGMVFTPSVGGMSHNPAEHTEPADLAAGADVLLQVLSVAGRGGATRTGECRLAGTHRFNCRRLRGRCSCR